MNYIDNYARRIIAVVLSTAIFLCLAGGTKSRKTTKQPTNNKIEQVRRQQQKTQREITRTKDEIARNRKETQTRLGELDRIRRSAADNSARMRALQAAVDSADLRISALNDSIEALERRVADLRKAYIRSMRAAQGERLSGTKLSFIFSAGSFREAWRRMRYIGEFNSWRAERTADLRNSTNLLRDQRAELDKMQLARSAQLTELGNAQKVLDNQNKESEKLVATLRSQGATLKDLLDEREQQARVLDAQLNRLIEAEQQRILREQREREAKERQRLAEEQKRKTQSEMTKPKNQSSQSSNSVPASSEKVPKPSSTPETISPQSGNFVANRGRLLFPITGSYRVVRPYGRQRNPDMPNVVTDNKGIDFEVKGGSTARAIFDGVVVSILQAPGLNTVVMVRHGNYYSIYTNLVGVKVNMNQKVVTGQTLGSVFTDPDDDNRGVIHFELRHEKSTLNPLEWVR